MTLTKRLTPMAVRVASLVNALFFVVEVLFTLAWLGWNTFGPVAARFDAPPYPLWLFLSNVMQAFLMPLLLVAQNVETALADAKEDKDLAVDQEELALLRQIRDLLTSGHSPVQ
ncbi:MAG: DUF1003 domain-containing protein [Patescibacteria group bacterium]|nr:DUF1003 domain-containing protein [Patescibacteria group bacterium]